MARRVTSKPIPPALLPAHVHTSHVVYFYPDKSPFSETDAVLVGDPKPAHSNLEAKVIRGIQFTGGDFKVLVSATLGGTWYAWLMPSDFEEGAALRAALKQSRSRKQNPRKMRRNRRNRRESGVQRFGRNAANLARLRRRFTELKARGGLKGVTETDYIASNMVKLLGTKTRLRNPLAIRGFTLVARHSGSPPLFFIGKKFARSGKPVVFKNSTSAMTVGRMLKLQYPQLRKFTLTAHRA